jgi:ATP-dependent DNA ligase
LKEALAKLPVKNVIMDGKVVGLDAHGVSQFIELMSRKGKPVFPHSICCASMAATCAICT